MTDAARLRWGALGVVAIAILAAAAAGWDNSATNDEPYHILAGFTCVREGHGDYNPEHPALTKLLSGLALQPLGLRAHLPGPRGSLAPVARLAVLSEEVRAFVYANTRASQTILDVARVPMLLFLAALLLGVWAWARFAWGEVEAFTALLATACQPLVLGHAFVVHTDVAAAATWVWTGYLTHRWVRGRRPGWIGVGAALGVALLTKFSAVLLAGIVAVVVVVWACRARRPRELLHLAGAAGLAFVILVAGTWPVVRNVSVDEEIATVDAHLKLWPGGQDRADALGTLAAFSVPLAHWGLGLAYVAETNAHGQGVNFLLGRTSTSGFAAYFPVAFVVKVSSPLLALLVLGTVAAFRRRDQSALALILLVVAYFAISLSASYNIGARHLLPVLPLAAMIATHGSRSWSRPARWVLGVALLIPPVISFPGYLSYFSEIVGGGRYGNRILNDSNLDWGQDWVRLGRQASQQGWAPLTYLYLGAGWPAHDCPGARDAIDLPAPPESGYIAVSRFVAAVGAEYLEARRAPEDADRVRLTLEAVRLRGRHVATIGNSLDVFRLEAR